MKSCSAKMFTRNGGKVLSKVNVENQPKFTCNSGIKTSLEEATIGQGAQGTYSEGGCNEFTCDMSLFNPHNAEIKKETKQEDGTLSMESISSKIKPEETLTSKDYMKERKSRNIIARGGRYARKPLKICFKKRSKAPKSNLKTGNDYDAGDPTFEQLKKSHLGSIEQLQTKINSNFENIEDMQSRRSPGGTWATFKSFVIPRKKGNPSSRMQSCFASKNRKETKAGNASLLNVSKPRSNSTRLKIPCIKLTRGKKKPGAWGMADEVYCTVQTTTSETNLNRLGSTQDVRSTMIKDNLSQSLVTVDLEEDSDPSNEQAINSHHSSQKCLVSTMTILGSDQTPQCTAESEIFTAYGLIDEETIHPDHASFFAGKAEQLCQSANAVEKSTENQLPFDKEKNTEEIKVNVLLQGHGRENDKQIESTSQQSEFDSTELFLSSSIDQYELPDLQYRPLLCSKISDGNTCGRGENDFSVHTGSLQISGNGLWSEDTVCSDDRQSDFNLEHEVSCSSNQYEDLLVETASSLVKAVIQSSIDQLIDEITFENGPQSPILQI